MALRTYYSYLLRIWRCDDADRCDWLASLQDPHSLEMISFSDLVDLYTYLSTLTEAQEKNTNHSSSAIDELLNK